MENINVLIVDDVPEMRKMLISILQRLGINHCVEAEDGKQAVDAFLSNQIDVVMLDIDLPVMDGMTVLGAIRKYHRDVFIVMVTGDSSIEQVQDAIAKGANGYVVKPYSEEKITDVINRYMLTNRNTDEIIQDLAMQHRKPKT